MTTNVPEHASEEEYRERFRQMGLRSGEARRAKKERGPREAIEAAMRKQISEHPDAVVEALLRSPRGVEVLLAHAAGIFSEPASRKEPSIIIVTSAFPARWRGKPARWLRLLQARDFRQLEAELAHHAELALQPEEAAA